MRGKIESGRYTELQDLCKDVSYFFDRFRAAHPLDFELVKHSETLEYEFASSVNAFKARRTQHM